MALDIQIINMTPDYVPYERPPQPFTLWSAIPRGLQSFIVDAQQLDAKALNDDALLSLRATLPPNFGYVLQDCRVMIGQDAAFNWSNIFNLNLQNFYRASSDTLTLGLQMSWRGDFLLVDPFGLTVRSTVWLDTEGIPSFPMVGSGSGIQVNLQMANPEDQASLIGTVNAYMSWWQFDLEQVRKFPINTPQPVDSR